MNIESDDHDIVIGHSCPKCGGRVYRNFTCHTWPQGAPGQETWMSCQGCDSAVEYSCDGSNDDGCGWSYTNGLNPRNPESAANNAARPDWMVPASEDSWLQPIGWPEPQVTRRKAARVVRSEAPRLVFEDE